MKYFFYTIRLLPPHEYDSKHVIFSSNALFFAMRLIQLPEEYDERTENIYTNALYLFMNLIHAPINQFFFKEDSKYSSKALYEIDSELDNTDIFRGTEEDFIEGIKLLIELEFLEKITENSFTFYEVPRKYWDNFINEEYFDENKNYIGPLIEENLHETKLEDFPITIRINWDE